MATLTVQQVPNLAEAGLAAVGFDAIQFANTYKVRGPSGTEYRVQDSYSTENCPGWVWRCCPSGSRPFEYKEPKGQWSIRRDFTWCDNCCCPRQECFLGPFGWWRPQSQLKVDRSNYTIDQPCTLCYNEWHITNLSADRNDLVVYGNEIYWCSTNLCCKDCITGTYSVLQNNQEVAVVERPGSIENWFLTNCNLRIGDQMFNASGLAAQREMYTVRFTNGAPDPVLVNKLAAMTLLIDMRNYEHIQKSNTPIEASSAPHRNRMRR